jgi:MoxR-like ATPase|tara:strand:+ start:178 stop:585 length:408 start_codon:yes stop_codon:yes gene_type:complete
LKAKRGLLEMDTERDKVEAINQCMSPEEVVSFRRQSAQVKASDSLLGYVQRLISFTRGKDELHFCLSPRGSLAIIRSAKTWALMCGRNHVVPENLRILLGWLHETGVNGTECDDERGYLLTGKRDLKMLHLDRSY